MLHLPNAALLTHFGKYEGLQSLTDLGHASAQPQTLHGVDISVCAACSSRWCDPTAQAEWT